LTKKAAFGAQHNRQRVHSVCTEPVGGYAMTAFPPTGKAERELPRRKTSLAACGRRHTRRHNDTPALNTLKVLRGAPISMGRGETPVRLQLTTARFCLFSLIFSFYPTKGGFSTMEQTNKQEAKSPIVREYKIGDITYIVKAVVKDGVKEDAATKVRRLIHNDLKREKSPV